MKWRKLGRLFKADGQRPWMQSHCSMPFAEPLDRDTVRVWFSPRDVENRSHTAWLDVDLRRPDQLLRLAEEPVLAPGPEGAFDHRGAMGSCMVGADGGRRLYYVGWSEHPTDPFHVAIGLATSTEGPSGGQPEFRRNGNKPILDRSEDDPIMVSTPFVHQDKGKWHMWYLSVTVWPDAKAPPHYDLRHAVGADGLSWRTDPSPCIALDYPREIAIARPCVRIDSGLWRMWYSHRGRDYAYRIGYADSRDGTKWTRRDDDAGIDVSASGWDSEMIAYPFVFDHGGARYMLYSGNGYGREGMGVAILERD